MLAGSGRVVNTDLTPARSQLGARHRCNPLPNQRSLAATEGRSAMVDQKEINLRRHDPRGVRLRREKQVANLVRHDDAQQIADVLALPLRHVFDALDQVLTPVCHPKTQSQGHWEAGVDLASDRGGAGESAEGANPDRQPDSSVLPRYPANPRATSGTHRSVRRSWSRHLSRARAPAAGGQHSHKSPRAAGAAPTGPPPRARPSRSTPLPPAQTRAGRGSDTFSALTLCTASRRVARSAGYTAASFSWLRNGLPCGARNSVQLLCPNLGWRSSIVQELGALRSATLHHLLADPIARWRVLAQAERMEDLMNDHQLGSSNEPVPPLEQRPADEDDATTRLCKCRHSGFALPFVAAVHKPHVVENVVSRIDGDLSEVCLQPSP